MHHGLPSHLDFLAPTGRVDYVVSILTSAPRCLHLLRPSSLRNFLLSPNIQQLPVNTLPQVPRAVRRGLGRARRGAGVGDLGVLPKCLLTIVSRTLSKLSRYVSTH